MHSTHEFSHISMNQTLWHQVPVIKAAVGISWMADVPVTLLLPSWLDWANLRSSSKILLFILDCKSWRCSEDKKKKNAYFTFKHNQRSNGILTTFYNLTSKNNSHYSTSKMHTVSVTQIIYLSETYRHIEIRWLQFHNITYAGHKIIFCISIPSWYNNLQLLSHLYDFVNSK